MKSPLAPRELFEKMLEYMPIATFDLVLEYEESGVIVVKRKIAPYKDVWALPGLRMLKGESIDACLKRIAAQELGLKNYSQAEDITGSIRREISYRKSTTRYLHLLCREGAEGAKISLNDDHFYEYKIVHSVPKPIGGMYQYYLNEYFTSH